MKKYVLIVGAFAIIAIAAWWHFLKIDFVVESGSAHIGDCVYIDGKFTDIFGPKIGTKIKFKSSEVVEQWYKGDCAPRLFHEKPVPGVIYIWKGETKGYVRAWTLS